MIVEIFESPFQSEQDSFGCHCYCACYSGDPRESDISEDKQREVEE